MTPRRKFRFIKELAAGGFGKVYLAEMVTGENFSTVVAIKLLLSEWAEHDEIVQRARDEARMLGRLRHRNIVRVEDLTVLQGHCAVVMEYLEGVDCKSLISFFEHSDQRMPLQAIFEIIGNTASALDAAFNHVPLQGGHPLALIHRDIKPSNVMVTVGGDVKLLDFGTARANFEEREAKTQQLAFGSQAYMAPERFLGDEDTPFTDIYSLGVTLYEMLKCENYGRIDLRPDKYNALVVERIGSIDFGEGLPPDIADQARATIAAMVSYGPEERPSAGQVVELMDVLSEEANDGSLRRFARKYVGTVMAANTHEADPDDPLTGSTLFEDRSTGFYRNTESEGLDEPPSGRQEKPSDPPDSSPTYEAPPQLSMPGPPPDLQTLDAGADLPPPPADLLPTVDVAAAAPPPVVEEPPAPPPVVEEPPAPEPSPPERKAPPKPEPPKKAPQPLVEAKTELPLPPEPALDFDPNKTLDMGSLGDLIGSAERQKSPGFEEAVPPKPPPVTSAPVSAPFKPAEIYEPDPLPRPKSKMPMILGALTVAVLVIGGGVALMGGGGGDSDLPSTPVAVAPAPPSTAPAPPPETQGDEEGQPEAASDQGSKGSGETESSRDDKGAQDDKGSRDDGGGQDAKGSQGSSQTQEEAGSDDPGEATPEETEGQPEETTEETTEEEGGDAQAEVEPEEVPEENPVAQVGSVRLKVRPFGSTVRIHGAGTSKSFEAKLGQPPKVYKNLPADSYRGSVTRPTDGKSVTKYFQVKPGQMCEYEFDMENYHKGWVLVSCN